ncbi:MAG: universal stress protein [Gordonia sp. (in: high G+C Gram-positive bacteria)]|uniref:universal stress protein n=1 Tax=Gordonia sp. (in: high G+C Gram-positive bacteria) TaxID=84139 RepID=UPI0039E56A29
MNIRSFSGTGDPGGENLVVGWDRTPAAQAALAAAVDLAGKLRAQLHIAHIADDSDLGVDPDSPTWEEQTKAAADEKAHWLRGQLRGLDTGWTYYSARGSAAAVLGQVARESGSRIVVIGKHRRGVAGLLSRVTRRPLADELVDAGLQVLVVPPA